MSDELKIRHFEEGEQVDALSVAGQDFTQYTVWPITAQVFEVGDEYWIPLIDSADMGSGTLGNFLTILQQHLGKPPIFINVINSRLRKKLEGMGIECRIVGYEQTQGVTA